MGKKKNKAKSGGIFGGSGGFGGAFRGVASALVTVGVATKLMTNNEGLPKRAEMTDGFKDFANLWVGRISGINPFPDGKQFEQKLNPMGWLNSEFIGGVIMTVTGGLLRGLGRKVGIKNKGINTAAAWLTSIGGGITTGAAIGGIFDPPQTGLTEPSFFGSNNAVIQSTVYDRPRIPAMG